MCKYSFWPRLCIYRQKGVKEAQMEEVLKIQGSVTEEYIKNWRPSSKLRYLQAREMIWRILLVQESPIGWWSLEPIAEAVQTRGDESIGPWRGWRTYRLVASPIGWLMYQVEDGENQDTFQSVERYHLSVERDYVIMNRFMVPPIGSSSSWSNKQFGNRRPLNRLVILHLSVGHVVGRIVGRFESVGRILMRLKTLISPIGWRNGPKSTYRLVDGMAEK